MAKCKFPGCNKSLVGKEKHICTSCKDKVANGAKKGAAIIGTAALAVLAVVATPGITKKDD